MDAAPSPTATAADVLSQAWACTCASSAAWAPYSGLSVRGSEATQVAVYLDGVAAQPGAVRCA
jgi:hypothetical protein